MKGPNEELPKTKRVKPEHWHDDVKRRDFGSDAAESPHIFSRSQLPDVCKRRNDRIQTLLKAVETEIQDRPSGKHYKGAVSSILYQGNGGL